ncbi:MAG: hypothetical protein HY898_02665 [Deltaproteobacteria bacterium]|nr:hypothetical protein [Deltaproteobacteria bacterium]
MLNRNTAIVAFVVSFVSGMIIMRSVESKIVKPENAIAKDASSAAPARPKANAGAARLELFVMSQCPYGVQVVDAVKPAKDKLGADLDLSIDYIGQGTSPDSLTSMHGPKEVAGDIVQLCAAKHFPDKHLAFTACQNKNYREVDKNWESCANEVGISSSRIGSCLKDGEGKKLLADSFARARERNASGSPTIFLNGKPYEGGRKTNDFIKAVCAATDGKPAACQNIQAAKPVNVTILTDKRCTECDTSRMAEGLKSKISTAVVKTLDYGDADGKKLYDELKPGNLPIVVFDKTIDGDPDSMAELAPALKTAGEYKYLPVGGEWNPVCMAEKGCEKPECKNALICRKEIPNHLEVFVMSQCPYGVKALDAMSEVLKNFGDKLEFVVHFIGDGDATKGLTSMHGQAEVDEDLREICAVKHYPKANKYMDYIWCRNKDIRSADWKKCTGGTTGIDTKVIETCWTGAEGKKLLEEEFKLASALGIGGSPTWLANGRHKFSGVDAETVRKNICEHNKGLKGCDAKLTAAQPGAPPEQGCGK